MSNLREFIQRVLAKRQSYRPKLEAVQRLISELSGHLEQLQRLADEATKSDDAPFELRQRAGVLTNAIRDLQSQVSTMMAKTANLLARITKTTINVCVTGKARQGKSTVLQAIAGLDDSVIPTSDGLPCTGAKSRIVHRNDDPHADVEFYTETEFLREVVHPYYEELHLSPFPASLDEFAGPLPPKGDLKASEGWRARISWTLSHVMRLERDREAPEKHAIYEKLRELHANIGHYRSLLKQGTLRIGLDKVRDYVSQFDLQDKANKRYFAVRCVNIYARFPNEDVTGLALIDLPGLGEIAKGHSERLVTSLQQEVDAVILVIRPSYGGAGWLAEDIKVFNVIKGAIPELDLADWLFVVLNEDGRNSRQVELLKSNFPQIGSKPRLIAVNCIEPDAVRQKLFLEVLRHLEENLERIDQRQMSVVCQDFSHLDRQVLSVVQPIRDYFQQDTIGTEDHQKFQELFNSFWKQLCTDLDNVADKYRKYVRTENVSKELADAVNNACEVAKNTAPVPSPDELKGWFHAEGGWDAVVQKELHHLRSYLTHCLAKILDGKFTKMVEDAWRDVLSQLVRGPLLRLLPPDVRTSGDPKAQLESFRQLLDPKNQPALTDGVDYLLNFTFSYLSHLHYRVREEMSPLDPRAFREEGEEDPVNAIAPNRQDARSGDEISRGLRSFYERVVYKVHKRLREEMEVSPMRAIFSMIEEVTDRLIRARDSKQEWDKLIYPRRAEIWPREFNRFAVASAQRQQWQTAIEKVIQTSEELRGALV